MEETMQEKFYGWKIVVFCGLIYALVGALGFTVGQLTLSYMMLDPSVTTSGNQRHKKAIA